MVNAQCDALSAQLHPVPPSIVSGQRLPERPDAERRGVSERASDGVEPGSLGADGRRRAPCRLARAQRDDVAPGGPQRGHPVELLVELVYALKAGYRQNASFVMNRKTQAAVRKFKDTTGQYLWQPALTANTPDSILNRPVHTSAYVPTIAAGAKSVAFGDFGYYWIADRQGRSFKRLNELFATTGQIGFMATQRVDGKLILPEAIKVLQQKA